ncbi:hypothetical protein Vafri_13605 [Volvox africanus]|nr:hypothetical protein Vafri_13605 [Volvox africanus]
MAVIAPFLQRQLYDEAVTEMADELRHKVDLLECSDSDISDNDAKGTARPHWELPKGTNGTAADRADEVLVRKRTNLAAFRRRNRPGSLTGPDKVSNWLLGSKDWSRQFLRSSISSPIIRKSRRSAGAVSGVFVFGGTYSGGPTRHVVSYEEFNNWWLRFNLRGRLEDAFPVLAPNTSGRTSWDVFVLTLVLYSAVTVPLAFSYGLPRYPALDAVEWILTAVYIIDISINFRTAYHDDDGNMVRDSWPVAHRYLITWFPIDFLATVPFDYIGLAAGLGDSESQLMILAVLKTPRLLRLVKLMRLLDRVRNANLFKVLQLILLMMMIAHWLACVWYVIARYAPGGNEWGFDTLDDENRLTWYLSAFYYSFLLLIGDNIQATNNYERLFFILALVAGACFYSAVVGNMALLVANMNTVAVRFRQKLDMTQDALRYMRVPEAQRERVQAFYDFITQFSHPGSEGLGFLSELTKGINEDLHIFLHSGTLMRIYLFKDCEQAFIRSLAMRMKIVTFIPGEVIFRQGDLGHEMYIIRAGCVAVVSKNSEVMSLLQAGDFFGEIALLTQSRRTAKCIALSNCDLAILNSFDIKVLMKEFPKSAHSLQEAARDRLRQLQIAGRAGKGSTPDGDEGDGDEDPDKRREREEVRLQRRSSITRFTTGRGVYSHEMSPVPSDGRAGGSSSCIDGTPQVSPLPLATAPRRDQVTWTTAAPVVSAGGSATAEKRTGVTAAGAAAMTEPPDGPDGNLPPASYVESSRNSYTSLGTEDSAREFVPRRRTNSVTSQGGLSTGASASASASNSRRNSGAGATAQANVVRAACAALSNTAANGDGRLQCSGGSSEPQAVATAIGLCDGGGGSGEPAAAAAAAAVSSTATSQVRPPMNKVRSRSSKAEGVLQNQPKGGGGGGGGDRHGDTSNPNLSQPAAVAAVPRPQQPPSPHVRNPTSSSSSWSALFTRRLGPRPSTPGVSSRRVRSRSSTSGEGTAISVEGQPTVLPVTTAATESPTPAVGASTAVSSTSDGAYLDATTRFDAVERFHPPGPMSPVVLPISAVSPVAVPDAVPTAKKFRASVLLFGRAIRAGPLAEAVEQNAPVLTKQTATMHTKLRAAAALSSMDGSSSGVAPAGCTTMAGGRDPRALQPMGNSRRISAANTVESRSQVLSPVISAAPGRRERRSSLILPYSTSSTTDFAAAVAAAMGIASPLLDSGGGGGGDGRQCCLQRCGYRFCPGGTYSS